MICFQIKVCTSDGVLVQHAVAGEATGDSDDIEVNAGNQDEDDDDRTSTTGDLSGDEYEEIHYNLKRRRVYV